MPQIPVSQSIDVTNYKTAILDRKHVRGRSFIQNPRKEFSNSIGDSTLWSRPEKKNNKAMVEDTTNSELESVNPIIDVDSLDVKKPMVSSEVKETELSPMKNGGGG